MNRQGSGSTTRIKKRWEIFMNSVTQKGRMLSCQEMKPKIIIFKDIFRSLGVFTFLSGNLIYEL